jgi:hypothetical protein
MKAEKEANDVSASQIAVRALIAHANDAPSIRFQPSHACSAQGLAENTADDNAACRVARELHGINFNHQK